LCFENILVRYFMDFVAVNFVSWSAMNAGMFAILVFVFLIVLYLVKLRSKWQIMFFGN
jgi:hypothetical protein